MPVTRTNTKRYVATCDVADCGWSTEVISVRVRAGEKLRHHLKVQHGLIQVIQPERNSTMKVQEETELPEQSKGPKLSEYSGQLVVFGSGWTKAKEQTQYGAREAIRADLFVYDTTAKTWQAPGSVLVFFATVIKRIEDAGVEDDLGGVLVQGTDRNSREWDLTPPSAAQAKLLAKFDKDTAVAGEPF